MKRTLFHQSSMTEGPVLQGMLAFFLPIMLGTLLQQLYSAVDAVVLGQFVGKTALAAVGGSDIVLINLCRLIVRRFRRHLAARGRAGARAGE